MILLILKDHAQNSSLMKEGVEKSLDQDEFLFEGGTTTL